MAKKYSLKFWIIFWTVSVIFLGSFYFYLKIKNSTTNSATGGFMSLIPTDSGRLEQLKTIGYFADYLMKNDDQEKTFLILFQNNMELRPGGGYIGSFGILKIKNGRLTLLQVHDLSNFDGRVPDGVEPPYPMKETLNIKSWKMRDSNYSPDFPTNAKRAEEFYYMGKGEEKFDGIVGINTNVLTSFLKVTGPVEIEGYPGTYDSENAVLDLEYQVEKGSYEQGIEVGDRKSIMNPLANSIIEKVFGLDNYKKIELAEILLNNLNAKDIQLYFKDSELEKRAKLASWSGETNQVWKNDYLAIVDANLGAFKSDYFIKRSFEYQVDFSESVPKAQLKITYNHTGKQKDWMTRDYLTYLRVYIPDGSWLLDSKNTGDIKFVEDLGKKYFGTIVTVPLNQSKIVEFNYTLPENIQPDAYNLLIQKQSGVENIPGTITVISKDGEKTVQNITLKGDWTLNK